MTANTYTGTTTINANTTLRIGANTAITAISAGNITNNGTLLLFMSNAFALNNTISGSGGITFNNVGDVTVSGTNSYTGVSTFGGGNVLVSDLGNGGVNSNLGASTSAASSLVFNGGTLRYTGTGVTIDRLFTLGTSSGTLDASGSGALIFGNAGAIVLVNTNARTLTLAGTGSATLTPTLSDNTGATSLTMAGSGTWTLAGSSSYTGVTTINSGILSVSTLADGGSNSNIGAATNVAGI